MKKYIFCLLFILILFLTACEQTKKFPIVTLTINKHVFVVEVASTYAQRAKGLMFRKELKANEGMLFVFPDDQILSFYMKNTLIPLSIAFISSDGKITQIEDMKPLDETTIFSHSPARYALEVPHGTFDKLSIEPGAVVNIPEKLP